MAPRIPVTDPKFKYVPSHATDLKALFKRIRKQQKKEAA
jgi:hypothetical protein